MGHFNMVEKVNDGACEPTTTSRMYE